MRLIPNIRNTRETFGAFWGGIAMPAMRQVSTPGSGERPRSSAPSPAEGRGSASRQDDGRKVHALLISEQREAMVCFDFCCLVDEMVSVKKKSCLIS